MAFVKDANGISFKNRLKIGALMGERFNWLPTPYLSFTALFITWMMYSAFRK
jgi:hypothetical protein